MKIIHIGWYNPQPVGGVGKAILEQTRALHAMGFQIEIWHFTPNVSEAKMMDCEAPFPVWHIPSCRNRIYRCLSLSAQAKIWIRTRLPEVGSFHIHSVFIPENNLIANLGRPYVLTPHGGWSDVVLNGTRKWLKFLWVVAREKPMWKGASVIQAVSAEEAKQLSKHPGMARIEVIPNGTVIPDNISRSDTRDCFLYLGRLDINQKGLDLFLEALKIIKSRNHKIPKVIIAGPDYRGGKAFIEDFCMRNDLLDMVELRGIVHGTEKDSLFRSARLFIHTSRWEGLPLVLLEALAYGVPCLLTPGTNVASEWSSAGCAFTTSENPLEIADSLIHISGLSLVNESNAASKLAIRDYSWSRIAEKLAAVYSLE